MIDMMYVLGLKKNLVSVAMLEDKGYDFVFSKGKARHWRVVAQAVGPFASWGFEENALDIYRTSQK